MQALLQINHKVWNKLGWMLRLSVLLGCGWLITQTFQEKWNFEIIWSSFPWLQLAVVLILTLPNWGIEVWRWKISLDHQEQESWREAGRQVFAGQALNWILPFTGGDLVSKMAPSQNKWKSGQIIYYNRAIMLGITVFFGSFGLYHFSSEYFESQLIFLILAILGMVFLGWFWSGFRKSLEHLNRLLWMLTILSVLRYAVFTLQFYILLRVFNPELSSVLILAGIGWVFLFRSIIPSLFGNLGVREASALMFFETLVINPMTILIPCLLIWTMNNVFPSILGLYYLIRFPFKIAT